MKIVKIRLRENFIFGKTRKKPGAKNTRSSVSKAVDKSRAQMPRSAYNNQINTCKVEHICSNLAHAAISRWPSVFQCSHQLVQTLICQGLDTTVT